VADRLFDNQGRLIARAFPNGNVYLRSYSADGSSTAPVRNSAGRCSTPTPLTPRSGSSSLAYVNGPTYNYDTQGRLVTISYPNGNLYQRTYNADGSSTATVTTSGNAWC